MTSSALGQVAEVFNGKTPSKAQKRNEGHPVLKIKDVDEYAQFRGTFESFVELELAESLATKWIQSGDSMILNAAHSADYIASKNHFAQKETEGALATGEWLILRPDQLKLSPDYLKHWVRSSETVFKMKSLVKGIHLYPKDVARLHIPLPSLPEQRRIAAVLDAADELRTKRRQAIAKLDTLTQAIFVDMFGGDLLKWPLVAIEDLAVDEKGSIRTGPFGSQLLHEEFVDEGVAVLGIDNAVQNEFAWGKQRFITEEKYKALSRYTVHPGDVLVTIMGTCGRVAVVPEDIQRAINTKHLCCITLDQGQANPLWVQASLLYHPGVLHQLGATHGAVMPGLNMGAIKRAEIPKPPMAIQAKFAATVRRAKASRELAAASMKQLDTLFGSLQQRAFAGEL